MASLPERNELLEKSLSYHVLLPNSSTHWPNSSTVDKSEPRSTSCYLMDDIIVSGRNAQGHLVDLQRLLQRLQDRCLRYRLYRCEFARTFVEYLSHRLTQNGVEKGHKVDTMKKVPQPSNVTKLRAFLCGIQFYAKFMPDLGPILNHLIVWRGKMSLEIGFRRSNRLFLISRKCCPFNGAKFCYFRLFLPTLVRLSRSFRPFRFCQLNTKSEKSWTVSHKQEPCHIQNGIQLYELTNTTYNSQWSSNLGSIECIDQRTLRKRHWHFLL